MLVYGIFTSSTTDPEIAGPMIAETPVSRGRSAAGVVS